MSRPVLSSAVRQISRPRPARATFSARFSPVPNPTPSFSASFCHSSYRTPTVPSAARQRNSRVRCAGDRTRASTTWLTAAQPRSAFSTSAPIFAPQVTQNPKAGEDGETLMVGISERAANRLRQITDPSSPSSTTKEENPYNHLRITVTSGGCHGFQYMMSLEPASKIDAEEDTIFEAEPLEDGGSAGGAKVVMDEPSLELLSGSTVDYTTELIGSQFKIVDNPRATSSCGCGTSFDVVD